jgi:hypothetical protein
VGPTSFLLSTWRRFFGSKVYKDFVVHYSHSAFVSLSENQAPPAFTIAMPRSRWQIALGFDTDRKLRWRAKTATPALYGVTNLIMAECVRKCANDTDAASLANPDGPPVKESFPHCLNHREECDPGERPACLSRHSCENAAPQISLASLCRELSHDGKLKTNIAMNNPQIHVL